MQTNQYDLVIIQQVKDLLEKDYKYQHTQTELARRFHINESKLRKGFTSVYQTPIYEYQVQLRIEKAKELLSTTDDAVKTVAYKVGFDIRNLNRQFKKRLGVSPYAWKKQLYGGGTQNGLVNKPDLSIF